MHIKSVLRNLGTLLIIFVATMLVSVGWGYYEYTLHPDPAHLRAVRALEWAMLTGVLLGLSFLLMARGCRGHLNIKEALLLVSHCWLWGAFISAMPFWFWALSLPEAERQGVEFVSFINCFFEAMSGLTTTGASILSDIPRLPRALLLWRSQLNWLGGLGIVVLFVAILPSLSGGGRQVYKAEATGIASDAGTADVPGTARILWMIYTGLTTIQALIMKAADPDLEWFTVICFSFSTASTAGFAVFGESAGALSPLCQWIIIFFMFIGGINYALYYDILQGRWRRLFADTEFRAYCAILFTCIVIVSLVIIEHPYHDMTETHALKDGGTIIRDATFQVVSIGTTTGFSNANSAQWPLATQLLLVMLMFIGGCGGSTSGGIKVIRIVSAVRLLGQEIERVFRPSVVRPLAFGRRVLSPAQKRGVLVLILLFVIFSGFGAFCLSILESNRDTSPMSMVIASIACLLNIGPGFDAVGVTENYLWFSGPSKVLLCLMMLLGRLELVTVLVLFHPRFWRRS